MQIRMIMLQLVVIDASSEQEQQTPVTNFDRPFPLCMSFPYLMNFDKT